VQTVFCTELVIVQTIFYTIRFKHIFSVQEEEEEEKKNPIVLVTQYAGHR